MDTTRRTLHHIGIVVNSIKEAAGVYRTAFGATLDGPPIHDPLQRVRLQFLRLPNDVIIELIEPASQDSPVVRALQKGGGVNHLCFEVPDLGVEVARLGSISVLITDPAPAVAFDGRRIVFLLLGGQTIVELLEARTTNDVRSPASHREVL